MTAQSIPEKPAILWWRLDFLLWFYTSKFWKESKKNEDDFTYNIVKAKVKYIMPNIWSKFLKFRIKSIFYCMQQRQYIYIYWHCPVKIIWMNYVDLKTCSWLQTCMKSYKYFLKIPENKQCQRFCPNIWI